MTNHVHLLLMPAQGQTLPSLLKALAGRQTRYVNRVEGRSGTLREGRYKSSPVDTESYVLECSRYIQLNSLRAGIVGRPEQYRWSSFGAKAGLREDRRLDLDPCYLAMGETEQQRQNRYAACVSRGVRPSKLMLIREALQRGQLTGSERFVDEIDRSSACAWRGEAKGVRQSAKNKSVPSPRPFDVVAAIFDETLPPTPTPAGLIDIRAWLVDACHPNRPFPDFRRVFLWLVHDHIFSRFGVSRNPGAFHCPMCPQDVCNLRDA